ncbi:MAG TPA: xanthine dehydrogenase family protein molybdopterin-binding subunit, partial [Burkholderiales bacterium]|nr:xanthine dehydrogenase family protein molybdopterin-binding subunit [Burkholderiales bacterium]
MKQAYIGRSVSRLEDAPLVRGEGRFAVNTSFPGELHMRIVRSPYAHGRLVRIDSAKARAVAVWTFADVAGVPPIEFRPTRVKGLEPYRQHVLAKDTVRYVGEPVAAVFAEDACSAEDAAELVEVMVDPLPPILAAEAGVEPTVIHKWYGDVEGAFARAHALIELDLAIGRHSGVPLETRAAIARYDRSRDVLELHAATKRPHANRDALARMLKRDPAFVQLYEGHIGGGFGVRGELYPEDVLVCLAAMRLGRPVKWIEDRHENLMACNHSRQQRHQVRAAIDAEGRILAIDDEFFHDQGAYVRTHGARVADLTAGMLPGMYRVPAYRARGHFRLTNKTPAATYRAPGRYEATFVCERLLDAIAAKLGIDRIEARRRNLIAKAEMPYARPMDVLEVETVLDSGDYAGLLDKALQAVKWPGLQAALRERRARGEAVGAGIALFLEKSGLGPLDATRARVDETGTVELVTGAASLGQGVETVLAQICADTLGVDYRAVRVIHGRTDRIERGFGSHASRTTVMTGEATRLAAANLRAKAIAAVEGMLDLPAEVLDIANGCVVRTDVHVAPLMTLAELARRTELVGEAEFRSEHMTYPYGVHIAVVAIDRDTGGVRLERYFVAYDIGRAINPMLVEGQIVGGVAQGIGGALYEEFVYDERGEPLSTTFADYLIPTASEIPPVQVLISEDA